MSGKKIKISQDKSTDGVEKKTIFCGFLLRISSASVSLSNEDGKKMHRGIKVWNVCVCECVWEGGANACLSVNISFCTNCSNILRNVKDLDNADC